MIIILINGQSWGKNIGTRYTFLYLKFIKLDAVISFIYIKSDALNKHMWRFGKQIWDFILMLFYLNLYKKRATEKNGKYNRKFSQNKASNLKMYYYLQLILSFWKPCSLRGL